MPRGIEIHNGELVFPDGMPPTIHMGTEASPLTQYVAGQIVQSAIINAIALGGDVVAVYGRVDATVALTGNPAAVKAKMSISATIAVTGSIRGLLIEVDINTGGSASDMMDGIRLDLYMEATASCPGNVAGIDMRNYVAGTCGVYYFMYLQENVAALMTAAFYVRVQDMDNLFYLFPTVTTAWSQTGNPANQNGWIKVSLAGNVRYIQLFSTAP